MHAHLRRGLLSSVFALGLAVLGTGAASADDSPLNDVTSGANGLVSGNQVDVKLHAPVHVSGNAVAVGGDSRARRQADAPAPRPSADADYTSGRNGILSGNQVGVDVHAPVRVTGQSIALFGDAFTDGSRHSCRTSSSTSPGNRTSGRSGLLAGNQIGLALLVPIDVSGNAVAVLGDAMSAGHARCATPSGPAPVTGGNLTSGAHSIAGGNQVDAPVTAPVGLTGNAVSVLGDATTTGATSTSSGSPAPATGGNQTTGAHSIVGGNQVDAPVMVPVDVSGNSAAGAGDASTGTADPADDAETGSSSGSDHGVDDSEVKGPSTAGDTPAAAANVQAAAKADVVLPNTGAGFTPGWLLLGALLVSVGLLLTTRSRRV